MNESRYLFDEERAKQNVSKFLQEKLKDDVENGKKASDKVKELSAALGCTPQAINQYKLGTAFPKTENLIKIAKYFNCSLNYLIGLSPVESPDASIDSMHEYTGLSQEAIEILHILSRDARFMQAVNFVLSRISFYREVIGPVQKVIDSLSATDLDEYELSEEELNILDTLEGKGWLIGSPFSCCTIYSDRAGNALCEILNREIFPNAEEKRNNSEIERHWLNAFYATKKNAEEQEAVDNGE